MDKSYEEISKNMYVVTGLDENEPTKAEILVGSALLDMMKEMIHLLPDDETEDIQKKLAFLANDLLTRPVDGMSIVLLDPTNEHKMMFN